MSEADWNDRYDRVELERLSFVEEQLEALLEEHKQSTESNIRGREIGKREGGILQRRQ